MDIINFGIKKSVLHSKCNERAKSIKSSKQRNSPFIPQAVLSACLLCVRHGAMLGTQPRTDQTGHLPSRGLRSHQGRRHSNTRLFQRTKVFAPGLLQNYSAFWMASFYPVSQRCPSETKKWYFDIIASGKDTPISLHDIMVFGQKIQKNLNGLLCLGESKTGSFASRC